jgi:FkbM family methyltransferase
MKTEIDNKELTSSRIKIKKNKTKPKYKFKKKANKNSFLTIIIYIFIIFGVISCLLYIIKLKRIFSPKRKKALKKFKKTIYQKLNLDNISNIFNYSFKYDEFDENINDQYIQLQNHFCENQSKNIINEYEDKIKIAKANYNGTNFDMFVYKYGDVVSNYILSTNCWDGYDTLEVLKALEYYSKKKNLENKDIYFLDIGSNVGWYTYFIGKYGYKILSFEASKINNYILYKNYCINKDVNVTLINKGLDKEDKICTLKIVSNNVGDGTIYCEDRDKLIPDFNGNTYSGIELTKLSRYINFLSKNNLAVIKIDVEGAEGNVFEGGKELITKYHVPFILMEYEIKLLAPHGTNVLEFLQFFEDNGYRFSLIDFFSKNYTSSSELIKSKRLLNLFLVYEKILE